MWFYNGKELDDSIIPEKAIGFIYLIENKVNGMKYIGRKLLTKAATKTVKGVKKKIRKESDWKDYWSSSPWLKEIIDAEGTANFSRTILVFCYGKAELNYCEEKLQYSLGVLESDKWYNDNIRSKQFKRWVKNYTVIDGVNKIIESFTEMNKITQSS